MTVFPASSSAPAPVRHSASASGTARDKSKPHKHDFSLELTRVIEPKGGPGVELATLEDAARFMGKMRPFRQRWPHWDYAAELVLIAATTGEEADIERERRRRWNERYGVTIGCDDAARFLLAR